MTKKQKQAFWAIAALAGIVLAFRAYKRPKRIVVRNINWDDQTLDVATPIGEFYIDKKAEEKNFGEDITKKETEKYLFGIRNYRDVLEVFLVHKAKGDPISLQQIRIDFEQKTEAYSATKLAQA